MLKWTLIDYSEKRGVEEHKVYECLADALQDADGDWRHMSDNDRKNTTDFFVGLCNVDARGDYVEKENGELDVDVRTIAMSWTRETKSWLERCLGAPFGITLKDLTRKFGIPYRTAQNWSLKVSEAPIYLQDLIERMLWIEKELN